MVNLCPCLKGNNDSSDNESESQKHGLKAPLLQNMGNEEQIPNKNSSNSLNDHSRGFFN